MKYAKIVVKNNYEKRGDLVLRSYIRALEKINESRFLDGDRAFIYSVVDDNDNFHELFTNEIIDYDNYIFTDIEELFDVATMPNNEKELLTRIINKVLFKKDEELNFEVSTIEELAHDRAIEFDAYDKYLSRINPYQRLNEKNIDSYNDYDNLFRKIEEIKVMKKMDSVKKDVDYYRVYDYIEKEEKNLSKKLIRK